MSTPSNTSSIVRRIRIPLLTVFAILTLGAMLRSARDVREFGGVDLRARVVGALRLFRGQSPYVGWDKPSPPELTDPHGIAEISTCSYPPSLLLVYRIGADMDYRRVRYGWAAAEWSAMLATLLLLVAAESSEHKRLLLTAIGCLFFICGDFWRLHVERGQYYIFIALLWAIAWFRIRKRGANDILVGVTIGVAAALRPASLLVILPMAILQLRKAALGMVLGATAVLGASLAFGVGRWAEFAKLVRFFDAQSAGVVEYRTQVPT